MHITWHCCFPLTLPLQSSGVHCEINVDDCTPFTDPVTKEPKCFNKGKCVDGVGGYHCICPPGYVGERCEGDVNECLSNPCDPRGTHSCIQLTNNYRCECRTGYTGKQLGGYIKEFEGGYVSLPFWLVFSLHSLFYQPKWDQPFKVYGSFEFLLFTIANLSFLKQTFGQESSIDQIMLPWLTRWAIINWVANFD